MKFPALIILAALLSPLAHGASVDSQLEYLGNFIGGYPPHIDSDAQHESVVKSYEALKKELDAAITKAPNDESLLFKRGTLQAMGHNMDYPGAWEGAEADLKAVLSRKPSHIDAINELAELYVNAKPELAPQAELLFRAAQCYSGAVPNERSQRGLFFAFYYQGKMELAYKQASVLNALWPNNGYGGLLNTTEAVLKRTKGGVPTYKSNEFVATSCQKASDGT